MIPEAAVEAALNARLTFKNQRGMDNAANLMRHILEAAAPNLIQAAKAGAWDEGNDAGWDAARGEPEASNPYR